MKTLLDVFHSFKDRGSTTAFVYRTGVRRFEYTYEWLYTTVLQTASWLEKQGIHPGDHVVLWAPNSPWWGVVYWALIVRGCVIVPVDVTSGKKRAITIAKAADAVFVIQSKYTISPITELPHIAIEQLVQHTKTCSLYTAPKDCRSDIVVELVYTSGTTGDPKGVMLTHKNILTNSRQVTEHITVLPGYCFLSLLPLSHMFEQMGGFLVPLVKGASIVYMRTLKPTAIATALREESVSIVLAVPRLLQALKNSTERKFASLHMSWLLTGLLRVAESFSQAFRKRIFFFIHTKFGKQFVMFVSGGSALDEVTARFWQRMGFTVVEGYGLTECSPIISAQSQAHQTIGTVGKPLSGIATKIEDGELFVRGENVFAGYYHNPEATQQVLTSDGWFKTGDLVQVTASGELIIRGRRKEMIVTSSGVNIFPDDIERVLNTMPGIIDSCVVGVDGPDGEIVHAVLIPTTTRVDCQVIVDAANSQLDPAQRIVVFSKWPGTEFPKTTTLKIKKHIVKQQIMQHKSPLQSTDADRLLEIISQITHQPVTSVTEQARLVGDLGLSSIARIELVNCLEQEFRIDIAEDTITDATTVCDIRNLVTNRVVSKKKNIFRTRAFTVPGRTLRKIVDTCIHIPLLKVFAFSSITVHGVEHIRALSQPVVFIANHQSYLDGPALFMALPKTIRYRLASASLETLFFKSRQESWGWRLWAACYYQYATLLFGMFPITTNQTFRNTIVFMGKLIEQGIHILLFPEGERSRNKTSDELLPFQPGLGTIIQELHVPIVPVKIKEIEKILPPDKKWPSKGSVTVVIGQPIDCTTMSQEQILRTARAAIETL